jgi:hypothetical protein
MQAECRRMASANGWITWSRRRWSGGVEGSSHPVDRLLDETEATVSVGVRQLCCREGTNARSFDRGRENLKATAQIETGEELFRQLVEGEGKAVLQASRQEQQLKLDWSGADCRAQPPEGDPTTRIYVSADGVLVPTTTQAEKDKRRARVKKWRQETPRKQRGPLRRLPPVKKGSDQRYKQVYVTIVYDQEQEHRLVGVTCGEIKGLKRLLREEAERVGIMDAAERRGLVDGAVCLKNTLEELPLQAITLDFYHFSEHVGEAAVQTLKTKSESDAWLGEVLHTARHEGYAPFFQQILDWRSPLRGGKRKAADALLGYVAPRQEMIHYEECDGHGWDVGSGPMESMCGVTTDRIKGRGRRWDLDNAEAIMALEALYQSTGLWDRYWSNALQHLN